MGDRPTAHLWFGTKSTEDHPWAVRYEDDKEVVPDEDTYDAEQRLEAADGSTVLVNLSNFDDDGPLALAAEYHQADWDGAIDLATLECPGLGAIADLLRVALEEGWPPITVDDLAWHLGASYG